MAQEKDTSNFMPADYATFEKVQQLVAMAERDEEISQDLLSGERDRVIRAFALAGLGEDEVNEAISLVDRVFGSKLETAIRPW